jgi:hypothetical protein
MHILYSDDYPISQHSIIANLSAEETETRFNFTLVPNNLPRSFNHALTFARKNQKYYNSNDLLLYKSLKPLPVMSDYENKLVFSYISDEVGFGVSTLKKITKDSVIIEYEGARLGFLEPRIDDIVYGYSTSRSFLLRNLDTAGLLSQKDYDLYIRTNSEISAKDHGNIARFMNHCPAESDLKIMTRNVGIQELPVQKPTLIKLFMVAARAGAFELWGKLV